MSSFNKLGLAIGISGIALGLVGLFLLRNHAIIRPTEIVCNIVIGGLVIFCATKR